LRTRRLTLSSGAIYFVDVDELDDAMLNLSTIAVALGVTVQAEDPIPTLLQVLHKPGSAILARARSTLEPRVTIFTTSPNSLTEIRCAISRACAASSGRKKSCLDLRRRPFQ
jgi:hypothetical protein